MHSFYVVVISLFLVSHFIEDLMLSFAHSIFTIINSNLNSIRINYNQ